MLLKVRALEIRNFIVPKNNFLIENTISILTQYAMFMFLIIVHILTFDLPHIELQVKEINAPRAKPPFQMAGIY